MDCSAWALSRGPFAFASMLTVHPSHQTTNRSRGPKELEVRHPQAQDFELSRYTMAFASHTGPPFAFGPLWKTRR